MTKKPISLSNDNINQLYYDVANMIRPNQYLVVTPRSATARIIKRLMENKDALDALGLERKKDL